MAKFLTTTGISFHLENIVKDAKEKLILISPYLQINERLRQLLDDKDREKIDIRVIYGKNQLQPSENDWLKSKHFVRLSYRKNLHAKCFMNESEALITSMNLYEYSQVNNDEMGVLVTKTEDFPLYTSVYEEAMRLIRVSEDEGRINTEKISPVAVNSDTKIRRGGRAQTTVRESGFCIRCKKTLKADPSQPYCRDCYSTWAQYKNNNYEEKHCHLCGNDTKSTMRKPVCDDCFRKFKDVFVFAAV